VGRRTRAQLQLEPQVRLQTPQTTPLTSPALDGDADLPRAAGLAPAALHLGEESVGDAAAPRLAPRSPDDLGALPAPIASLVRQQLDLLAVPVVNWQGQAWPGAMMNGAFWRESQAGAQAQPEESDPGEEHGAHGPQKEGVSAVWRTRLSMHMPSLGPVEIDLRLTGKTLELRIAAADVNAATTLQNAASVLPGRMAAAGLQLAQCLVRKTPEPLPTGEMSDAETFRTAGLDENRSNNNASADSSGTSPVAWSAPPCLTG
jgi:hypothetical protein